jgi:hypothetical protein
MHILHLNERTRRRIRKYGDIYYEKILQTGVSALMIAISLVIPLQATLKKKALI